MSKTSKQFILSLDQGTTSSRAVIYDHTGKVAALAQKEFKQIFPEAGWVEHDPKDIWKSQNRVMHDALRKANIGAADLAAIGITNQRETALVWNRETGKPICNAIVWQDRRTSAYCDELTEQNYTNMIREKTGLVIDAYFSASKWKWILEHVEGAREQAEEGKLALGTVDSWLIWKLTKGKVHVTDVTNASRTMLYNIHELKWDSELLDLFGIPASMLPEVKSSSEVYGETAKGRLSVPVPIAGIAGDQQAATFGQMCLNAGSVKCTYGTGCFILCNTGETAVDSKNKLITTIAWQINGQTIYALEGSIFMGGAVIQWLRDGLGIIKSSAEVEQLAESVEDNGGVVFVPAFTGLGAPHWDQYARGMVAGLTRGVTGGHIARAALESIAFQVNDVVQAMAEDAGFPIEELKVDGGAVVNDLLMQFQADLSGISVIRPENIETTSLGAAYLAGLATGFWESIEEIREQWAMDQEFSGSIKKEKRKNLLSEWEKAISRAASWQTK